MFKLYLIIIPGHDLKWMSFCVEHPLVQGYDRCGREEKIEILERLSKEETLHLVVLDSCINLEMVERK